MAIQFRKTGQRQETEQGEPSRAAAEPVWITPASKAQAEERLFGFLCGLHNESLRVTQPLLVEQATLGELYANPHPDLVEALRRCLEQLLRTISPSPNRWGSVALSPNVWGMALAVYNCLVSQQEAAENTPDPVADFTAALIAALPAARALPELLAYHAVINQPAESLPRLSATRQELLRALLMRSPLSAVYHLQLATPPPLTPLAAELLPGWSRRVIPPDLWSSLADWLAVLALLFADPAIARYLRRRWLTLPDTRAACRNQGLLLEALRRQGGYRDFIFMFYEAYEYFCAETVADPWRGKVRRWPLLDRINRLLDADGVTSAAAEVALRLNRWGNEYFLKFYALIELIAAEGALPRDYYHLRDLPLALVPLHKRVSTSGGAELKLNNVTFEENR